MPSQNSSIPAGDARTAPGKQSQKKDLYLQLNAPQIKVLLIYAAFCPGDQPF